MEKNTKILLGLGAAIAAYLILKPKKSVASAVTPNTVQTVVPTQISARQTHINNMFSTTDANGIIQNPYSGDNGRNFDDYALGNKVTQAEINVAKAMYPNAILAKTNYTPPVVKESVSMLLTETPFDWSVGTIKSF